MRFTVIATLLFFVFFAGAQNNDAIDINYKKLDIPPLTSDCFFFSSDNILWFSTARGLTSFDGTEIHSYYPDTSAINNYYFSAITAITEDSSKNLWIATRKIALIYFNTSSKKCITVNLENEKSELHLDNNKKYILVSKPLGDIEELLPPDIFQRIHHSTVVNLNYVTHFVRSDGGYVKLQTGEELTVSKSKRDAVMERLGLKKD